MSVRGRTYRLSGVVQGVGFRWWTRERAAEFGIKGDVRNLQDGSVLVRAYGGPEVMERFAECLRRGPDGSRVVAMEESEWSPPTSPTAFVIERTQRPE